MGGIEAAPLPGALRSSRGGIPGAGELDAAMEPCGPRGHGEVAGERARGVSLWLDADGCLNWDFTHSDVHPDEYAEGLRLLRNEFR
jgi:hypothetical protein